MPDTQKFKCRECDGTGLRAPCRECIYCDGEGVIYREVETMWDRVGRGRALTSGKIGNDFKRESERSAADAEREWNELSNAIDRADPVSIPSDEKPRLLPLRHYIGNFDL
jgi:hypothetical protein